MSQSSPHAVTVARDEHFLGQPDRSRDAPSQRAAQPQGHFGRNATLLCVSALTIMSGATITPSLPAIEAHFAGDGDVALLTRLVLTLPALFIMLCAPVAGWLADRFSKTSLMAGSTLLFAAAGVSGLFLDTLAGLLVGRALLGVAVAGVMTAATALVGDYFSGAARDRFMGWQSAFVGFGGLVFLGGGGLLADVHWRAPFAIYGVALLLAPAIFFFMREPARVAPALTPLELGAGDRRLMIAAIYGVAVCNMGAYYLLPTQLPFYLSSQAIGSASFSGLVLGLGNLMGAGVSLGYARLRRRLGLVCVFALAFGVTSVGLALLGAARTPFAVLTAALVVGAGLGAAAPNLAAAALTFASPAARGRVAGGLTASIFGGSFLSPFISQPVIKAAGYSALYSCAALFVGVMALAFAALALFRAIRRVT